MKNIAQGNVSVNVQYTYITIQAFNLKKKSKIIYKFFFNSI